MRVAQIIDGELVLVITPTPKPEPGGRDDPSPLPGVENSEEEWQAFEASHPPTTVTVPLPPMGGTDDYI